MVLICCVATYPQTPQPRTIWHKADTSQSPLADFGLSQDGRTLTFPGGGLNQFGIRDLRSGKNAFFTVAPGCELRKAIPGSHGNRAIYLCRDPKRDPILRVLSNTGHDRDVARWAAADSRLQHSTKDGTQALIWNALASGGELSLIRLSDGSKTVLLSDRAIAGGRAGAALSADGAILAYRRTMHPHDRTSSVGVFARVLATGADIAVEPPSPRDCRIAGWSAKRSLTYVCSGKSGSEARRWQFNGNDAPKALRGFEFSEEIVDLGVLPDDTFVYAVPGRTVNSYVVGIDPVTGKIISDPQRVNLGHNGDSMLPKWFDGGRRISYVVGGPSRRFELVSRAFPEDSERTLSVDLESASGNMWAPDGSLVLTGIKKGVGFGFFRVNIESGKSEPLLLSSATHRDFSSMPAISPDGRILYYRDDNRHGVYARDLNDSSERMIYQAPGPPFPRIRSLYLSPDGKWVAFVVSRNGSNILMLVPSSGGAARELYIAKQPDAILDVQGHTWMVDSRRVLFVKTRGDRRSLWSISIEGGAAQAAGLEMVGLRHLSVHPDGQWLAFAAGDEGTVRIQSLRFD